MPAGRMRLLRLIHSPVVAERAPRVSGVDEFAFRRASATEPSCRHRDPETDRCPADKHRACPQKRAERTQRAEPRNEPDPRNEPRHRVDRLWRVRRPRRGRGGTSAGPPRRALSPAVAWWSARRTTQTHRTGRTSMAPGTTAGPRATDVRPEDRRARPAACSLAPAAFSPAGGSVVLPVTRSVPSAASPPSAGRRRWLVAIGPSRLRSTEGRPAPPLPSVRVWCV